MTSSSHVPLCGEDLPHAHTWLLAAVCGYLRAAVGADPGGAGLGRRGPEGSGVRSLLCGAVAAAREVQEDIHEEEDAQPDVARDAGVLRPAGPCAVQAAARERVG